jgi:SsrA-binding protein
VDLRDAYAQVERGEAWLHNMHIAPYDPGSRENVPTRRTRKLLLHRRQINRLLGRTVERGLTVIALRVYLERGYAKVELGLARGRRQWDKRRAIAERETRRDEERAFADRRRGG